MSGLYKCHMPTFILVDLASGVDPTSLSSSTFGEVGTGGEVFTFLTAALDNYKINKMQEGKVPANLVSRLIIR